MLRILAFETKLSPGSLENSRCHCRVRLPSVCQPTYNEHYSQRLVEILKRNPGPQMSYQVAFCFWLLSFEQNIAEQINK